MNRLAPTQSVTCPACGRGLKVPEAVTHHCDGSVRFCLFCMNCAGLFELSLEHQVEPISPERLLVMAAQPWFPELMKLRDAIRSTRN